MTCVVISRSPTEKSMTMDAPKINKRICSLLWVADITGIKKTNKSCTLEALFQMEKSSELSPINRYGSTVAKFLTIHRSKKVV